MISFRLTTICLRPALSGLAPPNSSSSISTILDSRFSSSYMSSDEYSNINSRSSSRGSLLLTFDIHSISFASSVIRTHSFRDVIISAELSSSVRNPKMSSSEMPRNAYSLSALIFSLDFSSSDFKKSRFSSCELINLIIFTPLYTAVLYHMYWKIN